MTYGSNFVDKLDVVFSKNKLSSNCSQLLNSLSFFSPFTAITAVMKRLKQNLCVSQCFRSTSSTIPYFGRTIWTTDFIFPNSTMYYQVERGSFGFNLRLKSVYSMSLSVRYRRDMLPSNTSVLLSGFKTSRYQTNANCFLSFSGVQ